VLVGDLAVPVVGAGGEVGAFGLALGELGHGAAGLGFGVHLGEFVDLFEQLVG